MVIQDLSRFFCHPLDLLVSPAIILYQGSHLTSQMVYYLITHVGLFLAVAHGRLIHLDELSQPAIVLLESDQLDCRSLKLFVQALNLAHQCCFAPPEHDDLGIFLLDDSVNFGGLLECLLVQ